jgi:hypothetical protein
VQGYFQRVTTGGVGTSLLADSAVTAVKMAAGSVTAPKIANGVVVRSLNAQTDAVTLAGTNGLGVSQGSGTVTVTSNATPADTADTIVSRDGSGSFSADSVTAKRLALYTTGSSTVGVLTIGGLSFLHAYGFQNTFVGHAAGNFSVTGQGNSGFGNGAATLVTTGSYNDAFGYNALHFDTTGSNNAAFGTAALVSNATGSYNAAFGTMALFSATGANSNSAFGYRALYSNTTASANSAFGYLALGANTTGGSNAAFGRNALSANTTAWYNSAFGDQALGLNTTGVTNAAFGYGALGSNTTGGANAAFGVSALASNTTASGNSAFGAFALQNNGTVSNNVAIGFGALRYLTSGFNNIALGYGAGDQLTSGSNNIYIGANNGAATETNTLRIGEPGMVAYIAGIYGTTSGGGVAVYVNSTGQLGTMTSSRRYKEQIVDVAAESDILMKLRPVSFYYRPDLDETHLRQYGLVAEEVAEVAPGLVAYDEDGAPQGVRYHFVNAMLLNEVQKQRRRIEELEARLASLEAVLIQSR